MSYFIIYYYKKISDEIFEEKSPLLIKYKFNIHFK